MLSLLLLTLLQSVIISSAPTYPTILIHGIASNKNELVELSVALTNKGISVHNMEIGNGIVDSIFMNMNTQCEVLAHNIDKLNISTDKINMIGISQGGLLARCYTERYSHTIKLVSHLITIASPHMGIYSEDWTFESLSYWKNPFRYIEYLFDNDFLVYINNEKNHVDSGTYKYNLANIDNFTMIWSGIDSVIAPIASSQFEYYDIEFAQEHDKLVVDPLIDSTIFLNDNIGLYELYEKRRLHRYRIDCPHNEFKLTKCFNEVRGPSGMTLMDIIMEAYPFNNGGLSI
jgi:palmitoyl-protein thioesterase